MEFVLLTIRLILFGVLTVAGVAKLLDRAGSEKAIEAFGTPKPFVRTFAVLIPISEIAFGVLLLFTTFSWIAAAGALLLFVTFIGGMLVQLIKGEAPDCHCFGQLHSEPVGSRSLVRNIILAILPVTLLISGRGHQGLPIGETDAQIASNVVLALLSVVVIVAVSYLSRLSAENESLKRRIEFIETIENGGVPIERDDAGDPTDSLPIGAPFPGFKLPDLTGKQVSSRSLMADAIPTFFLFVGPACKPCKAMLDEFAAWKREFEGKIRFVFVSKGSAAENFERFGEDLGRDILLQKEMEFGAQLYIKWTPSALFVNGDGNIASHPAVGDMAIRDLVGKLRSEDFSKPSFYVKNSQRRGRVKIGESIPEFETADLDGKPVTRQTFLGTRTLAFFLSTTCSYCGEVIDQIRRWESSPERNGTNAIVFSDGDLETHRRYRLSTPIVIDAGHQLSGNLGMFSVPSGVLIDENGVIATETALGGAMIWSLVGRKPE